MKFILVVVLFLFCFQAFPVTDNKQSGVHLSIERTEAYYQKLMKQYADLKLVDGDFTTAEADAITDAYCDKILNHLLAHPEIKKRSVGDHLKKFFHDIKMETRVLTRTHGLAISITFLIIEITELPMKAIAVAIGHPVVIVLYEVLQPGLLVPTLTIAIKSFIREQKIKKLYGDKTLYRQWKTEEKSARKETKIKSGKEIIFADSEKQYLIKNSNLGTKTLQLFGLMKKRLDYGSLKKAVKPLQSHKINLIMKNHMSNQIKSKLILKVVAKDYPEYFNVMMERYSSGAKNKSIDPLDEKLVLWMQTLFYAEDKDSTDSLLKMFPRSISPLILAELWVNEIMPVFFEYNEAYKLKRYRFLAKNYLPFLIKLRKLALSSGVMPAWTPTLENEFESYLLARP